MNSVAILEDLVTRNDLSGYFFSYPIDIVCECLVSAPVFVSGDFTLALSFAYSVRFIFIFPPP